MKLSTLDALPSFALLGPGFTGGSFLLLRELQAAVRGEPLLVYAPFETAGSAPQLFAASSALRCEVEFDLEAPPLTVTLEAPDHAKKVEQIRQDIARGDVYQVCLTERAHLAPVSGAGLLSALCHRGVPRFAAWVRLPGGEEFVCASPELFFETQGSRVHAEPMKGTARPGAHGALEASEKDRAELAMITDLLRNDLTRVCRPRSVRVENERRLLELPYALQTVSDVEGTLEEETTPLDVLAALHPGGSITGAPKEAALDRIRALERTPRRAYCGTLGLWTTERSVFSILIRTAQKDPDGWTYGVGGGIVFDSDPEKELEELHVKLGALRWPTRSSG